MFPLTSIFMCSGLAPSISLILAAQKAMAVGSVQPVAMSSSSFRIAVYAASLNLLSMTLSEIVKEILCFDN
jgi:hypothetical protein